MKTEQSAGGVVFKRKDNKTFILIAKHSAYHRWVFPKGLIGDKIQNESKEDTALREVQEETGVNGKILYPLKPVIYWYQFEGQKIKKTVYYFVMEYLAGDITKHDFEMEDVKWELLENVSTKLAFKGDKKVWEEAKLYIQTLF